MNSNYSLPVNLGNPVERSIEDFAHIIKDQVGGPSQIEHRDAVEDDPQRRKPDISKAKEVRKLLDCDCRTNGAMSPQVLGWEPLVPLEKGLEKTINYFRRELDRSDHAERNIPHPDEYQVKSEI